MGKYDLVEEVLTTHNAAFHFTGTLIQPGKPLVFGHLRTEDNGERGTSNALLRPSWQPRLH